MSATDLPFDAVIVVDWSSASSPSPVRPSGNAIWIGEAGPGGEESRYCRTRTEAEAEIGRRIDRLRSAGRRVLVGFDFPQGYPAGFATRLTGVPSAQSIWAWIAKRLTDGPDNKNTRFQLADGINARFGGRGPFWGRPGQYDLPHLPARKHVDYPALGLAERRTVETLVPRAQPVWKLYTTGSVGAQALTGMPVIHRLSQRPDTSVWPFEGPDRPVVLAEVYPSLLAAEVRADPGPITDETQVRLLSRALLRASKRGQLAQMLDVPGIAREEGWILGAGHVASLREVLS